MPNKIIIFSLEGCDHCTSLMSRLSKLSIPHEEIETTKNFALWDVIVSKIKHDVLPTTLIMNSDTDESHVYIPGVDYNTENEIVEIIKTYI